MTICEANTPYAKGSHRALLGIVSNDKKKILICQLTPKFTS